MSRGRKTVVTSDVVFCSIHLFHRFLFEALVKSLLSHQDNNKICCFINLLQSLEILALSIEYTNIKTLMDSSMLSTTSRYCSFVLRYVKICGSR